MLVFMKRVAFLAADQRGSSTVELALVAPLLFLVTLGLVTLGFVMNFYITLSAATAAGVRGFALDAPVYIGSSASTLATTPFTDVQSQLLANAGLLPHFNKNPALNATGGITVTSLCVFAAGSTCAATGATCASDSTCGTLLNGLGGGGSYLASLSTSYPCFIPFRIYGFTSCTLTSSETYALQ